MQIDYFLNQKVINKIDNRLFTTILFKSLKPKVNFDFDVALNDDKHLTNYMMAYLVRRTDHIYNEIRTLNIVALLYLEHEADGYSFDEVFLAVNALELGAKPKNKLDKIALNIIEINRLINQIDFQINENNYELIIHLLFRNTNLNLDRKINYLRSEHNLLGLNLEIQFNDIEAEIKNIFHFAQQKTEDSADGLTKIILILFGLIVIQPHQKYNLTLSFLIVNWYLKQHQINVFQSLDLITFFNHWTILINELNQASRHNMNFDAFLKVVKSVIGKSVRHNYLNKLLSQWIEENYDQDIFNLRIKFALMAIIQSRATSVSVNDIYQHYRVGEIPLCADKLIKQDLHWLTQQKLIKFDSNQGGYVTTHKELTKLKHLLR